MQYIKYFFWRLIVKLTLLSDYSLRMLMHLAVNQDSLVTISETADRFGISKNHLMKVAHQLGRFGFIETIRGRSGGLRLAKPLEDINLGEVIRKMEQSSVLVECFPGGKGGCLITKECRLKSILHGAQDAFFDHLDAFFLSDLITENQKLETLLLENA